MMQISMWVKATAGCSKRLFPQFCWPGWDAWPSAGPFSPTCSQHAQYQTTKAPFAAPREAKPLHDPHDATFRDVARLLDKKVPVCLSAAIKSNSSNTPGPGTYKTRLAAHFGLSGLQVYGKSRGFGFGHPSRQQSAAAQGSWAGFIFPPLSLAHLRGWTRSSLIYRGKGAKDPTSQLLIRRQPRVLPRRCARRGRERVRAGMQERVRAGMRERVRAGQRTAPRGFRRPGPASTGSRLREK